MIYILTAYRGIVKRTYYYSTPAGMQQARRELEAAGATTALRSEEVDNPAPTRDFT